MNHKTTVDIKNIPHREIYVKILDTLEILDSGEIMEIIHDHDPEAMKDQLSQIMPGMFEWSYFEKGPVDWRIGIKKISNTSKVKKTLKNTKLDGFAEGYPSIH